MIIATWNISGGFVSQNSIGDEGFENIQHYIDELKHIRPEIICLQEAHASDKVSQPQQIADALGLEYVVSEAPSESHLKDGERLSISIISKYPIKASRFILLPNPKLKFTWREQVAYSFDKGLMEAEITYDDRVVRVLSGHTVPYHRFERNFLDEEFKETREIIENEIIGDHSPAVIGMDLNFDDEYSLLPNVFKNKFASILEAGPTRKNGKKTDKIFVSKDWRSVGSKIIKGDTDHYLCYADIELI
jgi:endonuclease/exonuclease/phosphatase family metal-dependent hydrolase